MPDESGQQLLIYRNRSVAGGVNSFAFATDIDDNQAVELENIDASVPGQRKSRLGVQVVATGITFGPILALAGFQGVNKESELLAVTPGATYPAVANLRLWSWDGKSSLWSLVGQLTGFTCATMGVQIVTGMDLQSSPGKPYFARIFSEASPARAIAYDGTALLFTDSTAGAPFAGMFPAAYQLNRGFASGNGANRGLVSFTTTALYAITGWNPSVSVTLGGGERQLVRCLHPFRSNDMICFMADRIDVLEMNESSIDNYLSAYTSWAREVIDTEIGCAGHLAVCATGEDLLFVDQFGNVRSLNRTITDNQQGTKSLPISTPIQSYIDRINPTAMRKCTAMFHDRFAFFGFPLDSATDVSHVLVLDVVTKAWYGPWTGKFPAKVMATATMSDPAAAARFQDPSLYLGSANGVAGDGAPGLVYHAFDGTTDFGAPIAIRETTKRISFGQLETPKAFRRIYQMWEASGGETVLLEARRDGREWVYLATFSVLGDESTIPLTFPFSFGGVGIVRWTKSLEQFEETPFDIEFRTTCTCTTQVKQLGYTLSAHAKNINWMTDS